MFGEQASNAQPGIRAQVCQPTLAAIILASQPGGRATGARVWHMNSEVLIRTVTGLYEHDPRAEVLAAILDVLQPVRSFVVRNGSQMHHDAHADRHPTNRGIMPCRKANQSKICVMS